MLTCLRLSPRFCINMQTGTNFLTERKSLVTGVYLAEGGWLCIRMEGVYGR